VRTLSLLPAFKEKFPEAEIHWITKSSSSSLFEGNPYVSKVHVLPHIPKETFDALYNFDIDQPATELAQSIQAEKKYGFYAESGFAAAYNMGAEYYLNTLFDDGIKKENKKTYQQMMFDVAELQYKGEHCTIFLNKEDEHYAIEFLKTHNITKKRLIGIHMGASPRWPSKVWHPSHVKEFIKQAKEKGYEILLFAGPDEISEQKQMIEDMTLDKIKVHANNPHNTIKQFSSLVDKCNVMVCCDSLALHIALALKKFTIGLFFCTPPNEVESYGLLVKLVAPKLYEFFPEKMDQYNEELVKSITPSQVMHKIQSIAGETNKNHQFAIV